MRKIEIWLKRNARTAAIASCLMLLSVGGAYIVTRNYYQGLLAQAHPIFVAHSPYTFLHPILGISLPGDQFNDKFPDVRNGIQSIAAAQPRGTLTRYAIYVRDLNTGNWTGIHQNDPFDPASLLKVVVAIAAYKQSETSPNYLSTPLVYTPELAHINAQLLFAQPAELSVGQAYTVPYLIKKELVDSDNSAVYTLLNSIDPQILNSIYDDLSIPQPSSVSSEGYKLTALEYSRFFRILYNGTLDLSWAHSERILESLSQSTFTSGIVAGVPNTVPVAHKYGEHVSASEGKPTSIELSDCGIVYKPEKPYFLCIMTEGKDQTALASIIAEISRFVYQKLSA